MAQQYDEARRLYVDDDPDGFSRVVRPADRNRFTGAQLPQLAATEFLTENADVVGVQPEWFSGAALGAAAPTDLEDGSPGSSEIELRFAGEKRQFDTTTVVYQQTWRGIPVWRSGLTVTLRTSPARIGNVHNTTYPEIDVELPSRTDLKRGVTGTSGLMRTAFDVAFTLRSANTRDDRRQVEVVSNTLVIARYDAARRLSD